MSSLWKSRASESWKRETLVSIKWPAGQQSLIATNLIQKCERMKYKKSEPLLQILMYSNVSVVTSNSSMSCVRVIHRASIKTLSSKKYSIHLLVLFSLFIQWWVCTFSEKFYYQSNDPKTT